MTDTADKEPMAVEVLPPLPHSPYLYAEWNSPIDKISRTMYTADHMRAYALAALSAVQAVPGWLPIESAPKRAPGMILTDGSLVTYGGWVSDIDQGADWEGQLGCADWWAVDGKDGFQPTHWMPLPAAPLQGADTP